MSFVTWLGLPVAITLVASLIMVWLSRLPRTNTHQDIESFARFRGALARQMAEPTPPGPVPLSSSPAAGLAVGTAADAADTVASNATIVEERRRPVRTGVAASPDR